MIKATFIIIALLAGSTFQSTRQFIGDDRMRVLTMANIEAVDFYVAIAKMFADFYAESFEGPASLISNLKSMSVEERANFFGSITRYIDSYTALADGIKNIAMEEMDKVVAGDSEAFFTRMKQDLTAYTYALIREDFMADKSVYVDAMYHTIDLVKWMYEERLSKGSWSKLIGPNTSGDQYNQIKEATIGRLRRGNIKLQMECGLLVCSVVGDHYNPFIPKKEAKYYQLVEKRMIDSIRDDVREETDEFVQSYIVPTMIKMVEKGYMTKEEKRLAWFKQCLSSSAGIYKFPHQKMIYRAILSNSFTEPGSNINNVAYGQRFKRFLVNKIEGANGVSKLKIGNEEMRLAKLDYLAAKPELIEPTEFTIEMIGDLFRTKGNINNYLWFIRLFKYYVDKFDQMEERLSDERAGRLQEIYEELYKLLLEQRVGSTDVDSKPDLFVKLIKGDYFDKVSGVKGRSKFIPAVFILSAVTFDDSIEYKEEYENFDGKMEYPKALFPNDEFLLDYQKFRGKKNYPKARVGTIYNVVIPQVGQITEDEHGALKHPTVIGGMKNALAAGKKIVKLSELNPAFQEQENEEVLIYILETKKSSPKGSWEVY